MKAQPWGSTISVEGADAFQWITSDTHLGHGRILEYMPNRIQAAYSHGGHDQAIIARWNARVGPFDRVLHLGDFAFGTREQVANFRAQLNGEITLIVGNHDRSAEAMLEAGCVRTATRLEWRHPEFGMILARHRPLKCSYAEVVACCPSVLLHGHNHSTVRPELIRVPGTGNTLLVEYAIDVGVDGSDELAPTTLRHLMATRPYLRIIPEFQADGDGNRHL